MDERVKFKKIFENRIDYFTESVESGTTVVQQEQDYEDVHVIESGYVKVVDTNKNGHERVLLILKKGEAFPLIWAFDDPEKTVYRYEALDDCEFIKCSLKDFKSTLSTDAQFTKIAMEMFVHLTWDALERIKSLQMPFTYEKLLRVLPYIATKIGSRRSKNEYEIPKKFTQLEMASLLGSSRESLSSHFQKAVNNKIIVNEEGCRVLDLNKIPQEFVFTKWFKEN